MRSAVRSLWIAIPLLAAAIVAGCSDTTTAVESGPIEGIWVADAFNGALFVVITTDSLIYYTALDTDDCVDRYAYGLTAVGGNDYLLASAVNFTEITSTITQVDDELTWRTPVGSALFQRSNQDPRDLDVCAGGGDDPALTCSSLPAIDVGQDVTGALEDGDTVERDRFYDVYSFQPAEPLNPAEISLTAVGFDAYLYLYDAGGALIAENDDNREGFTSAGLSLPLNPVCYRVEVTTVSANEDGTYTLRID